MIDYVDYDKQQEDRIYSRMATEQARGAIKAGMDIAGVGDDGPGGRDATRVASAVPRIQPRLKSNSPFAGLKPTPQGTISTPQEPVNYQDFGLRSTSFATGTAIVDTYGLVAGATEIKTLFWGATVAVNGETVATKLGRAMHSIYKSGEIDGITTFKEFTGVKGIRPDFVDFGTKTIYELKPNNARAIQQGIKQLNKYKALFEQQYGGTWKIVLDHY